MLLTSLCLSSKIEKRLIEMRDKQFKSFVELEEVIAEMEALIEVEKRERNSNSVGGSSQESGESSSESRSITRRKMADEIWIKKVKSCDDVWQKRDSKTEKRHGPTIRSSMKTANNVKSASRQKRIAFADHQRRTSDESAAQDGKYGRHQLAHFYGTNNSVSETPTRLCSDEDSAFFGTSWTSSVSSYENRKHSFRSSSGSSGVFSPLSGKIQKVLCFLLSHKLPL